MAGGTDTLRGAEPNGHDHGGARWGGRSARRKEAVVVDAQRAGLDDYVAFVVELGSDNDHSAEHRRLAEPLAPK